MIFFEDVITTVANMCVCDGNCDCASCSCDVNCDSWGCSCDANCDS